MLFSVQKQSSLLVARVRCFHFGVPWENFKLRVKSEKSIVGVLIILAFFAVKVGLELASNKLGSEEVQAIQELADSYESTFAAVESLEDLLAAVRSSETANQAIPNLPSTFKEYRQALQELTAAALSHDEVVEETFRTSDANLKKYDELKEQVYNFQDRLQRMVNLVDAEQTRVGQLKGLPVEFWEVCRVEYYRTVIAYLDIQDKVSNFNNLPTADQDGVRELLALIEKHGHRQVLIITLGGVSQFQLEDYRQKCDQVAEAGVEVAAWYESGSRQGTIAIAPTKQFEQFLAAFPEAAIVQHDEARREIILQPEAVREVAQEDDQPAPDFSLDHGVPEAEEVKSFLTDRERRLAERTIRELPEPGDDNYHEQLADAMIRGGDFFTRIDAAEALIQIEPSEIEDKKLRQRIARHFRDWAYQEDIGKDFDVAVRGLVHYGGEHSVPYLIELLDRRRLSASDALFEALAQVPSEETAEAVARLLGDFFNHRAAVACLRRMGTPAEQVLIDVAPSDDPAVSLAAVQLLGDVGTEKSYPLLRRAVSKSRNANVIRAAKDSLRKIQRRVAREKEKEAA